MRALITGITGQDGSYLAELLLDKGYEVYGMVRRSASPNYWRIQHLLDDRSIKLVYGDVTDQISIERAIETVKPHEIYNLAAQSFVGVSWEQPEYTFNVNALGLLRILEVVRKRIPYCRVYQASTSEMYGNPLTSPQNEDTPFKPDSPYAISKLAAHHIARNYRESYGMFIACGILFNHESERRGIEFVTRKISYGVAKIVLGKQDYIELGNLDSKRDWGYAPEYVYAMWKMLRQDEPDDFVIATNEAHSVREFVQEAFKVAEQETGKVDAENWQQYIRINPRYLRPVDVFELRGDYSKAKAILKWKPKTTFKKLVKIMVLADLHRLEESENDG